jgi:hypothetical protein
MDKKAKPKRSRVKLALAILAVVAACGFVYMRYRTAYPNRPTAPPSSVSAGGPPSPEEMKKQRAEFEAQMQFTREQMDKLREISSRHNPAEGPAAMGETLKEMGPYMSPAQQARAREYMSRQAEKQVNEAAKVLPPAELERFRNKLQSRIREKEPKPKPTP